MHFVSPGSFQGDKTLLSLPLLLLNPMKLKKEPNFFILEPRILEHVIPVAILIPRRKLKLLTFCTAQNRHCCCWCKLSQAASAEYCGNSETGNVLSEASETQGLTEFLKYKEKEKL